ncbi:MAG TPA: DUF2188 domain-containing protein [Verrucomicrobiae bacterium]|nr:DUF2188 domain-containing protein [Verrucomicrobiae bacterium]
MASSLSRFFVLPSNEGDWLIFREGTQRPVHRLDDKENAVETARAMAREDAPSEVMVERRDGKFHRQYAFAPGGADLH